MVDITQHYIFHLLHELHILSMLKIWIVSSYRFHAIFFYTIQGAA